MTAAAEYIDGALITATFALVVALFVRAIQTVRRHGRHRAER
jgi:hypothetical protein